MLHTLVCRITAPLEQSNFKVFPFPASKFVKYCLYFSSTSLATGGGQLHCIAEDLFPISWINTFSAKYRLFTTQKFSAKQSEMVFEE